MKHITFLWIPTIVLILKSKCLILPGFSLKKCSSPIFQDPTNKSHFKSNFSKKVPQPPLSKMSANQHFHSLKMLGVKGMLNKPFPTLRGS